MSCDKENCDGCTRAYLISANHWCYDERFALQGLCNTGQQKGGMQIKRLYNGIENIHSLKPILPRVYVKPKRDE